MPIEYWVQADPTLPDAQFAVVTPPVINEVNLVIARNQVLPRWDYVEDTFWIRSYTSSNASYDMSQLRNLYDILKQDATYQYFVGVVRDWAREPSDSDAVISGITIFNPGESQLPGTVPTLRCSFLFYFQLDSLVHFGAASPDYKWLFGSLAHELGHQRASLLHQNEDGNWVYHTHTMKAYTCLMQSAPSAGTMELRRFCRPDPDYLGDSSCQALLARTSGY